MRPSMETPPRSDPEMPDECASLALVTGRERIVARKKRSISSQTPSARETPPLLRDTFDLHWLDVDDTSVAGRTFKQYRGIERTGSRKIIQPLLAQAIHDHHINRSRIADRLKALDNTQAAEFFAEEMPRSANTRKGNFGEVVASEHLIQRYGFAMPVLKLRYRDSHNLPMRGEDIVAFEVDNDGRIVQLAIGEAKAIVLFRRATVREAHARLKSAFNPRPMTLSMLANILYDRGEDSLGQQLDDISIALTKGDFPRSHWIFLINETQPDDPFAVLVDNEEALADLCCVAVRLERLSCFVDELFDTPPVHDTGEC